MVKFASPSCVHFISFGFLLATTCVWVWVVCSLHSVTTGSRDRANVSLIILYNYYYYYYYPVPIQKVTPQILKFPWYLDTIHGNCYHENYQLYCCCYTQRPLLSFRYENNAYDMSWWGSTLVQSCAWTKSLVQHPPSVISFLCFFSLIYNVLFSISFLFIINIKNIYIVSVVHNNWLPKPLFLYGSIVLLSTLVLSS